MVAVSQANKPLLWWHGQWPSVLGDTMRNAAPLDQLSGEPGDTKSECNAALRGAREMSERAKVQRCASFMT